MNILGFSALAGLVATWGKPSVQAWAEKTLDIFAVCCVAVAMIAAVVTAWRLHAHSRMLKRKLRAATGDGTGWDFGERKATAMQFMSGMIVRMLIERRDEFLMVKTECGCGWLLRRRKPPDGGVWPGVARKIEDSEVVSVANRFAAEHLEKLMVIDPELNSIRFCQKDFSDILSE